MRRAGWPLSPARARRNLPTSADTGPHSRSHNKAKFVRDAGQAARSIEVHSRPTQERHVWNARLLCSQVSPFPCSRTHCAHGVRRVGNENPLIAMNQGCVCLLRLQHGLARRIKRVPRDSTKVPKSPATKGRSEASPNECPSIRRLVPGGRRECRADRRGGRDQLHHPLPPPVSPFNHSGRWRPSWSEP